MIQRRHFRIRGRVQGVCFRYATKEQADALGLTGWVRNCPDGSVEVVAEGPTARLDVLSEWLKRGPPAARVMEVQVVEEPPTNAFEGFAITG
jgi:acylphosphatase